MRLGDGVGYHPAALRGITSIALVLLVPGVARASGPDVFGLGSEAIGRGGAMTAVAEGWDATFYNPAGLALSGRRELTLGYQRYFSGLEIETAGGGVEDQPIVLPDSFVLGASLPIGDRVGIGIGSMVLPDVIVRARTHGPEEPFFPYYDNRTQRLAIYPAIGVRVTDWLALGAGANFFAGLNGFARASEGSTAALEASVFEEIFSQIALHAGARIDASETLRFGLAYRQSFGAPFTTRAQVLVAGVPIEVLVDARTLVTPHEFSAGAALRLGALDLSLDATLSLWALERSPFTRVEAIVNGVRIVPPVPQDGLYRNTVAIRTGGAFDHRLSEDLVLTYRLGASFEPSMIEDQPGRTNLIDGHKIGVGLGLGATFPRLLRRPMRIDLHGSGTLVTSRRYDKVVSPIDATREDPSALADEDATMPGDQITNPGYPWVRGGGTVWSVGITATFELEE